ncbi:hypothetical protein JHK87_055586 [Glycine soja]|nr:hypothetical protein JHK87_055586 [Glycine soja]
MRQLREENANLKAWLAIQHLALPPPPPPYPPCSPSPPPTHAETHTQESHTQLSSYNHHEHPPIHSRLRSVDIHHDVVHWHPFMDGIMDTPLPTTWKILNIERYDGTSDSNQHLHTFTMQVNLHFNDDTVMCKSKLAGGSTQCEDLIHTIKECVALKDKIKKLIQQGTLGNYIYTPNNNRGGYSGCDSG